MLTGRTDTVRTIGKRGSLPTKDHHERRRRSSTVGLAFLVMLVAFGCEPEFLEIGPETTVHSEPLRPDGVVDYTAHLEFPTGPNLYLAALALTQDDRYVSWDTIADPLDLFSQPPLPFQTSNREAAEAWLGAIDFSLFDEYLRLPDSQEFTCAVPAEPLVGIAQPPVLEEVVALLLYRAERSPLAQASMSLERALEASRYVRRFVYFQVVLGLSLESSTWKTIASWSKRNPERLRALAPEILRIDARVQAAPCSQVIVEHQLVSLQEMLDGYAKVTRSIDRGRLPYSREMDEVLRCFVLSTTAWREALSTLVEPAQLEEQLRPEDFPPPVSLAHAVLPDMRESAIALNHGRVMTAGLRWTTLALVAHVADVDEPTPPPVGRAQRIETDSEIRWTFDCGEIHASTSWSK